MKLLAAHVRVAVVAVSLSIAGGSAFARDDVAAVTDLTGKFLEAQRSFDLPALRALAAENYVEISPVGELDDRAKMLGFYAPEKKTQAPPLTIDNELTRVYGDVGIQTVKLTYTMTASGETRKLSLRATLVAHRSAGEWKMVSAQYTGIRPPPPPRN
jgi:ketosteroid isomerase-like protein